MSNLRPLLGALTTKSATVALVSDVLVRTRPPISALLIDVSGNLHVGSEPTPGAVDALHRLISMGFPLRLCSNTSKESTLDLVKRLDELGFGISKAQTSMTQVGPDGSHTPSRLVWTSIGAVAQALKGVGSTTPYLLLSDSARAEVMETLQSSQENSAYDSVVVGLVPAFFDYEHLNTAFRILKGEMSASNRLEQPPWLIATHRAKYIQSSEGKLSLGPGPFIAALENAAGPNIPTKVVGKPEADFFKMVINDFGDLHAFGKTDRAHSPDSPQPRIVVIGDDVEADLGGGAVELGLWRVLVQTGKYRVGDESRLGIVPPDEVWDSFASFVDSLLFGFGSQ